MHTRVHDFLFASSAIRLFFSDVRNQPLLLSPSIVRRDGEISSCAIASVRFCRRRALYDGIGRKRTDRFVSRCFSRMFSHPTETERCGTRCSRGTLPRVVGSEKSGQIMRANVQVAWSFRLVVVGPFSSRGRNPPFLRGRASTVSRRSPRFTLCVTQPRSSR